MPLVVLVLLPVTIRPAWAQDADSARAGRAAGRAAGKAAGKAGPQVFVGAFGGVATLSADAATRVWPSRFASASYDPENGPAIEGFAGVHLSQYLSAEIEYSWDRHDLHLSGIEALVPCDELSGGPCGAVGFYKQVRSSTQQALVASLLVYFRERPSRVRPYLAVGAGVAGLASTTMADHRSGDGADALAPAARFSSIGPAFEAAVGIDLRIHRTWRFRYSFAETIRDNPIARRLTPPGLRPLATFRNLFGFTREL